MDTMAIMSAMPSRYIHRVHPVAAEDFFGGSRFKEILMRYMVNATLIPRKKANSDEDIDPIEVMSNLLKQGRSIIIYPEGSRGVPGVMTDFKKGIGYLAIKNSGIKHTTVRYNDPTVVNLIKIVSIYSAVLSPGRIPGIYPPYFRKFSAVSFGLKTIDV